MHLRVDGYQRLAVELMQLMQREGIVATQPGWQDGVLPRMTEKMNAKLDPEAHGRALRNLARVFTWAGMIDDAERIGTEAMELLGDDGTFAFMRGRWAQTRG